MTDTRHTEPSVPAVSRRVSPRGTAEMLAIVLIVSGVVMMMQPFWLVLFTWSFLVTLSGTILFVVGSKLPQ